MKLLIGIRNVILTWTGIYLCVAFGWQDLDPSNWDVITRAMTSFLFLTVGAIIFGATMQMDND